MRACLVLVLALAAPMSTRSETEPLDPTARLASNDYVDQLPVVGDVGWLYAQYLEFRAFPALDRAFQARQAGRTQDAIAELERIVSDYDVLPRANYMLAVLYTEVGKPDAAVRASSAVLDNAPDFAPAHLYRGLARLQLNRPEAALSDFRAAADGAQLTTEDRRFAEHMAIEAAVAAERFDRAWALLDTLSGFEGYRYLRLRGVVLDGLERFEEAERAYLEAADAAPDPETKAQALAFAAEMARRDGRVDEARQRLQQALRKAPKSADVLHRLARLANEQDDIETVETLVLRALETKPAPGERLSLLTLLAEVGGVERAISLAKRELERLPEADTTRLRRFTANLLSGQGSALEAARQFEKLGQDADNVQALISAGIAYLEAGRPERAAAVLERARERTDGPRLVEHLANAYVQSGRPQDALGVLQTAEIAGRTSEQAAQLRYLRGLALEALKRPDEAAEAFGAAVSQQPETRLYRMAYGNALALADRPGDAAAQFRKAIAIKDTADARQRLATVLAEAGEVEDATGLLEGLRRELPEDSQQRADVMEQLGNLYAELGRYRKSAEASLGSITPDDAFAGEKLLRSGINFAQAKEWQAGLEVLDRARQALPGDSALYLEALERSAVVAAEAEKPAAAVSHYRAMLEHPKLPRPRRLDLQRRLAIVAEAADDHSTAMQTYQSIVDSPDATPKQRRRALESLGISAERAEEYPRAIAAYRQLLGYDDLPIEQRSELLRRIAVLANVSGRTDLATRAYRELVGLRGAPLTLSTEAARSLATMASQGAAGLDPNGVVQTLRDLLEEPNLERANRLEVLAALSNLAVSLGRYELMVHTERRRLDLLQPDGARWTTAMTRLANGYERLGRLREAINTLEILVDRSDTDDARRRYLEGIAINASQLGDHARAVEAFDRLIALGNADWQAYEGLGQALRAMGDCARAVDAFREARQRGGGSTSHLYSGYCYDTMDYPGLAIAHLNAGRHAPDADLPPVLRVNVLETLGFLYAESNQHGRAAAAWQEALAIAARPDIRLRTARALRLSERLDVASRMHALVDVSQLSPTLRPLYYDELADLERASGDRSTAIAALDAAIAIQRTPERLFRRGLLLAQSSEDALAYADLREAHEGAPDIADIRAALGYAESRRDNAEEAIQHLEPVVRAEVDRLPLYEDLAYMNKRVYRNAEASIWFERVVDNQPIYPVTTQAEADRRDRQIFAARRENQVLNNQWDLRAFSVFRSDGLTDDFDPTAQSLLTSQGGIELAHRLDWLDGPVEGKPVGFRDGRTVQVFGRLNWGYEEEGLELDDDSLLAGIGARWKPFGDHSLFLSGERLIGIGEATRDDWLVRASYSWDRGLDIKPVADDWFFATSFFDAAYFVGSGDRVVLTAQGQVGWSLKLAQNLVVTPNMSASFQQQFPTAGDGDSATAWELGPGVRARYWFDEPRYQAYSAYADIGLGYAAGVDGDEEPTHGLVLTLQLGL